MKNFQYITLTNNLISTVLIPLPAVSSDIATSTMLDVETFNGKFTTVTMSEACKNRLLEIQDQNFDVIIVPLPVLMLSNELKLNRGQLYTAYVIDRVNKVLSVSKF